MSSAKEMADQLLLSELPFGWRDVDNDQPLYVSQDINGAMDHKIFKRPRPPRSGLGALKVQDEKREMEVWTRYNVVVMFSYCK